jgi:hypothetical protein
MPLQLFIMLFCLVTKYQSVFDAMHEYCLVTLFQSLLLIMMTSFTIGSENLSLNVSFCVCH